MTSTALIPAADLSHLKHQPGGAEWLRHLPGLLQVMLARWSLEIDGATFGGGSVSHVVPVRQHGLPAVLKLQFPHPECRHEADALALWNGDGAIQLLDHDAERHALLLERCEPGKFLADAELADPMVVAAELLNSLWKPATAPFTSLQYEAQGWRTALKVAEATATEDEALLIRAALQKLDSLLTSSEESILLHQDLHGHNILSSIRQPWLAIDPKPLAGERAFGLAPLIRSFEFGETRQDLFGRVRRLCQLLNVCEERAVSWTIAQTMAWSFDSSYGARHRRTVRWLLEG
ncbi:phosphotransferase [Roseibium sp. CAU 1637]|uniref:Phosphotransferase n=1 Tax=Roseibium limicola TaxID=2816037 RepID=A0A939ET60_9HYPH|nr:phosphotransferase [Roseibium limicola]